MNSGGGVIWREWEMAGGGGWIRGEEAHFLLLDPVSPYYSAKSVVPFQATVWVIPRDAKVQKKAGKIF